MASGRFEVGMVIPAWSPRVGVGSAGSALVVAVEPNRRAAWVVDANKPDSAAGPRRLDIVYDDRFGEKMVAFPDFLHSSFRVFRADKATETRAVPKNLHIPLVEKHSA